MSFDVAWIYYDFSYLIVASEFKTASGKPEVRIVAMVIFCIWCMRLSCRFACCDCVAFRLVALTQVRWRFGVVDCCCCCCCCFEFISTERRYFKCIWWSWNVHACACLLTLLLFCIVAHVAVDSLAVHSLASSLYRLFCTVWHFCWEFWLIFLRTSLLLTQT